MARSAASQAALAAEALEVFLRNRPPPVAGGPDVEHSASGEVSAGMVATDDREPPRRTRAAGWGASTAAVPGPPLRSPHTDWLRHTLVVTGPATGVEAFRSAASGAGTIPWRLDLDSLQEDWFHLLVSPAARELSLAGARVLAGQLSEAVERRHAFAASRVGRSRACPLDLHSLVPVPTDILALGPDHPDALGWLWRYWGTTEALRHIVPEMAGNAARRPDAVRSEETWRLSFWSADWTPWRAIARIREDWPALRFDVQPDYTVG